VGLWAEQTTLCRWDETCSSFKSPQSAVESGNVPLDLPNPFNFASLGETWDNFVLDWLEGAWNKILATRRGVNTLLAPESQATCPRVGVARKAQRKFLNQDRETIGSTLARGPKNDFKTRSVPSRQSCFFLRPALTCHIRSDGEGRTENANLPQLCKIYLSFTTFRQSFDGANSLLQKPQVNSCNAKL
jgi:hypothetical protein